MIRMSAKNKVFRQNKTSKQRWLILFVMFLSAIVLYIAEMSVSVALPFISNDFNWTTAQQGKLGGLLLGIFLLGFGFSSIFMSPQLDVYGSKKIFSVSLLICVFSSFLSAYFGEIYWMFLLTRVLLGISLGFLYPSTSKIVQGWFPVEERARANSLIFIGATLGIVISPLLLTPIMITFSWKVSFYLVALLVFLVFFPVILFVKDFPTEKVQKGGTKAGLHFTENMVSLIRNPQFQLILVASFAAGCAWWGVSLWLPTYLVEVHHLTLNEMSFEASIPYLGVVGGLLIGSWVSDVTRHRKRIIVVSLVSTTLLFLPLILLDLQSRVILLLNLFFLFLITQMSPPIFLTILQSKVPDQVIGSASGIRTGVANGGGIFGPLSIGILIAHTGSYNLGLIFIGMLTMVAGGVFQFYFNEDNT